MSIGSQIKNQAIYGGGKLKASIIGNAVQGGNVSAVLTGGTATAYQWTRNAVNISGATSSTYTVQAADRGAILGVVITTTAGATVAVAVTVPTAPLSVVAAAGINSVTGGFAAPADNGGSAITQYRMDVYRVSDNVLLGSAFGPASPLTLNGLTNGVAVYIKVSAANAVASGYGPQSAASNTVTPTQFQRKFASNRLQHPPGVGVIGTAGTLWQADSINLKAPDDWDATAPIFTFPGYYCARQAVGSDEVALTNDLVIRNASIFVNGTFVKMLTFGGQAGATIPANSSTPFVQNDRDPSIVIPRGAEFNIVVQTQIASGQYRLTSYYAGPKDGTATSGVSNRDAYVNGTTAFTAPSVGSSMYGPCAVTAEGWSVGCKPVPLIAGDSIGFGKNDDNALLATEMVFGYINRAMIDTSGPGRYCYGNFCVPGTRLDGLSDARFGFRKAILQSQGLPFTCIYVEMGINTPTASRITNWESIAGPFLAGLAGSKDIIGGTLLPQSAILNNSSGTDYVNQTALNNDAWNNYVKAAGGGVTKYFTKYVDNTPAFQDGSNPGKWPVPSYTTTLAVALTGVSSTDFVVNNPAPSVDDALVLNPGQASKTTKMVKSITDLGNGTTRVSTYFAFAATMAVGTAVKATNSEDGTHPTTQISKSGKAPLVAAKAAGIFT